MYLRITKAVPSEGLKEGDVVRFESRDEAAAHVGAENGVEVTRKTATDEHGNTVLVEHTFVDAAGTEYVFPPAKE